MRDYLDFKISRKKEAWEGRVSDFALEKTVLGNFFLNIFTTLIVIALFIVLYLAFIDQFLAGYLIVSVPLFGGFFFAGRAYENYKSAAEDVVRQYELSPRTAHLFFRLDLETFNHSLEDARSDATRTSITLETQGVTPATSGQATAVKAPTAKSPK